MASDNKNRLDAGLPILNSFEYVTREWLVVSVHLVRDITHNKKIRRFENLDERRRMMQSWSDYLDILKNGAQVIDLKRMV
ncbi:MAG: hypothetical protein QX191_01675 [Methylococcaceae bacterium]